MQILLFSMIQCCPALLRVPRFMNSQTPHHLIEARGVVQSVADFRFGARDTMLLLNCRNMDADYNHCV